MVLKNPEKYEDEELEDIAIIFGVDYDELTDRIEVPCKTGKFCIC